MVVDGQHEFIGLNGPFPCCIFLWLYKLDLQLLLIEHKTYTEMDINGRVWTDILNPQNKDVLM